MAADIDGDGDVDILSAGPSNAPGATVSDSFPAARSSCTWTCAGMSGGTCTASGPGSVVSDRLPNTLACTWTCAGADGGTCKVAGTDDIVDVVDPPVGGKVTYTASCTVVADATSPGRQHRHRGAHWRRDRPDTRQRHRYRCRHLARHLLLRRLRDRRHGGMARPGAGEIAPARSRGGRQEWGQADNGRSVTPGAGVNAALLGRVLCS